MTADGWSLDDKRAPLLDDDRLGCVSAETLSPEEHQKNNLPDVLTRWAERDGSERERARTDQSFCVPKDDIAAEGYDLSLNRYKEIVYEEIEHRPPTEIIADIERLEEEIRAGVDELKRMVG